MADAAITLTVLRGSIPDACYVDGGEVSASIALVEGLVALDLTITEIEVGTGDTDEVTFSYDDAGVPDDVVLEECNFSSFQCTCDCCAEKRCLEVVGPDDEVVDGTFHVTFIPGKLLLDQIRVYSPTPGTPFNFTLYSNGVAVTNSTSATGSPTVIDRADFTAAFSDGVIDEDSELFVEFNGAPAGAGAWSGFQMCLLGRWMP